MLNMSARGFLARKPVIDHLQQLRTSGGHFYLTIGESVLFKVCFEFSMKTSTISPEKLYFRHFLGCHLDTFGFHVSLLLGNVTIGAPKSFTTNLEVSWLTQLHVKSLPVTSSSFTLFPCMLTSSIPTLCPSDMLDSAQFF